MRRSVSASLAVQVLGDATVELQIAAAGERPVDEVLEVELDGSAVVVDELRTVAEGRLHVARVTAGRLTVAYRATVTGTQRPAAPTPLDRSTYLRPSRYAEADRLAALAAAEFGTRGGGQVLVGLVADWVHERLSYEPGSSRGTDGAADTLLAGMGVCRDYAHLAIALLRALDVPARMVSAYAPGLSPMDFHAVVEALVDGAWHVVDPTRLAPRTSLVRIATGRDAADTAFLSTSGAQTRLDEVWVSAVTEGDLPLDDHRWAALNR